MAGSFEKARVVVKLSITTKVELSDEGYLGTGSTVEEHLKKARSDVGAFELLLKQGGTDAKPAKAVFVVDSVEIIPKEK